MIHSSFQTSISRNCYARCSLSQTFLLFSGGEPHEAYAHVDDDDAHDYYYYY